MTYVIRFKKTAFSELKKLPTNVQLRIDDALKIFGNDPYNRALNIKKLKGYEFLFRLRIGDYRVLYEVHKREVIIFVIRIGHCKDIYD